MDGMQRPIYYHGFSSLITEWPITIPVIGAASNPFGYGRQVLCFYSMCQKKKREASENTETAFPYKMR